MINQILLTAVIFCSTASFSQTVSTIVDDPSTTFRDDLIFDTDGNLYCADYGGTSVFKRTPDGTVTTFATGFDTPNGLAFDSNGDMFMCDNQASIIYKLSSAGVVLDSFPTPFPSGIIKDIASDTMIFTVYSAQHELNKLAPDGSIHPFHSGAPLNGPVGLAYIGNDLYVGNFTDREVYRVEPDTLIYIATLPGVGALGFIAQVGNSLYGTGFQSNKIYEIILTEVDSTILYAGSSNGSVDGPLGSATFSQPNGIVANTAGDTLYISQYGTGKLRMIAGVSLGVESTTDLTEMVSVYPNPTSGGVTVDLPQFEETIIEVFKPDGTLIHQLKEISSAQVEVELSGEQGLYLMKITIGTQRKTVKIVKSN